MELHAYANETFCSSHQVTKLDRYIKQHSLLIKINEKAAEVQLSTRHHSLVSGR